MYAIRSYYGRDHMGIIPLYTGRDEFGNFYVASEMKALVPVCKTVAEFPPGHYLWSKNGSEPTRYYVRDWMEFSAVENNVTDKLALRDGLEDAVKRRITSYNVCYTKLLRLTPGNVQREM